ncbi:hypothetical protein O0R52_21875 (plasmid) [Bacillus halotolerans]|uniref:Uncharacterized protein n=1 Tax=Bacillus halotolerans TaxID=260554 RepID=A0ABY7I6N4_9BACI|nr:hypothetical protein [Bacillus halotolerans]WAT23648.1 hypothetical protein O0R52_21875 [Bacillus halotolerans]
MEKHIDHKECWNELSIWLSKSITYLNEIEREQKLDDDSKLRLRQKKLNYQNTLQKMREIENIFHSIKE